ncbi:MAG: bifunctional diguanylate cyclase/phosphodiesterase [Sulfurimonas sp.]|uniref:bifunctional diguanylate cyclase/phosphodiesterase n=1 Tax=Sulfurimonas sp. TaxID=2022749 RepID=UPI0025DB96B3|nr:bifunctional diguanylate cyclase/phosphodiesterase [Sulfurimonas sp.]MCK9490845.1 bifunctional diguanylate cyclase/phosphodiesterase [Sulfurimonas sp.]
MVKAKEFFLFLMLFILGVFFIYIYFFIKETQEEIFVKMQKNKIEDVSFILKNIEETLVTKNSIFSEEDLVSYLSNKHNRTNYEEMIALFITPNIKYIYLLHKDPENRFRFLLDASKEDKANFYQKFDVFNQEYELVYKTLKPQIIQQQKMQNLYLTYLYPIKSSNEIIGILSVDITSNIQSEILELLKPLETFFVILIIFIFLLMLMTIMQVFHYFITRKKIFTDPLTQVYNRNYLQEITPRLNLNNYSLAMIDLDHFKVINDIYGHKAGDAILAKCSLIMKSSIRDNDILLRYGGEEFMLLLYNRDSKDNLSEIYERIRKNISSHIFTYEKHKIEMQVSIGVHEYPASEKNLNEAIKVADKMLYIAKKEGRNRIIYHKESSKTTEISNSKDIYFVKQAIEEDRVLCYYQPIYECSSGEIFKYEALVRIIDINGQIIAPMQFLPELKHTNIHYKLTKRILSLVFDKFKDSSLRVSINMNFTDLINKDIEASLIDTFSSNPSLASRVTIEVLESDEIQNSALFKEKVKLLHSYGATVSIDDFGSGYSNFKSILDIEANYLKIDGSLVKNIATNEKDFKVVKSIIAFAKESNMIAIAEFVHSSEVYDKLSELGVEYMQGYFIAKPCERLLKRSELFES